MRSEYDATAFIIRLFDVVVKKAMQGHPPIASHQSMMLPGLGTFQTLYSFRNTLIAVRARGPFRHPVFASERRRKVSVEVSNYFRLPRFTVEPRLVGRREAANTHSVHAF